MNTFESLLVDSEIPTPIFIQVDNHLVINLAARDKLCDHISLEPNRLRTGLSARPPKTARTFLVNNSFARRTCRHIQENDKLRTKLITLLNERDLDLIELRVAGR